MINFPTKTNQTEASAAIPEATLAAATNQPHPSSSSLQSDLRTVTKAASELSSFLLGLYGQSATTLHDAAMRIFEGLEEQMHKGVSSGGSSKTGRCDFDDFMQAMQALISSSPISANTPVTFTDEIKQIVKLVFDNFKSSGDSSIGYLAWLSVMGFERTDTELLNQVKSAVEGMVTTDNQSFYKITDYYEKHNTSLALSASQPQLVESPFSSASSSSSSNKVVNKFTIMEAPPVFATAVKELRCGLTKREIDRTFTLLSSSPSTSHSILLKTLVGGKAGSKEEERGGGAADKNLFDTRVVSIVDKAVAFALDPSKGSNEQQSGSITSKASGSSITSGRVAVGLRSAKDVLLLIQMSLKGGKCDREALSRIILSASSKSASGKKLMVTRAMVEHGLLSLPLHTTDGELQV